MDFEYTQFEMIWFVCPMIDLQNQKCELNSNSSTFVNLTVTLWQLTCQFNFFLTWIFFFFKWRWTTVGCNPWHWYPKWYHGLYSQWSLLLVTSSALTHVHIIAKTWQSINAPHKTGQTGLMSHSCQQCLVFQWGNDWRYGYWLVFIVNLHSCTAINALLTTVVTALLQTFNVGPSVPVGWTPR